MNNVNRRQFLKWVGATTLLGSIGYPMLSFAKTNAHIVILGGGFGGVTCAKYLRRFDSSLKITLIEQNSQFVTCPFSNAVIGNLHNIDFITHKYDKLNTRHNINIINDTATEIDTVTKKIDLRKGNSIRYDRLVVSPGIDFRWNAIEGYDAAASRILPHAWKGGPQTVLLKKQLQAMPDGGTVIIAPPANPFRCPPGPYERASLIAYYLKQHKPKSKILILDSKNKFSKQTLFQDAWDSFYPDMIEWVPASDGGIVTSVDVKNKIVIADGEKHKADVINIIPPQKAGNIAHRAGLTNEQGWCPVDQKTFRSKQHKDIYVIGDASIAGKMPKSGYAASSQGKVCAAEMVAELQGKTVGISSWVNTCYSLITPDYGISVAAVYRLTDKGIVSVKGAGGVGPREVPAATRRKEAMYAEGWYRSITSDMFG